MKAATVKEKTQRQKFTTEEDSRLIELVNMYGCHSWKKIGQFMKTRTTRQCRERYLNYLSPGLVNGPWTAHEDKFLIEKVKEMGPSWSKIVKFFPTRSDVNIKNRYSLLISKGKVPPLKHRNKQAKKIKEEDKPKISELKITVKDVFADIESEFDSIWKSNINTNDPMLGDWQDPFI